MIGARREVEHGTAVSVWAAHLGDGAASTFHASVEEVEEGTGALTGMADLEGPPARSCSPTRATFPTDPVLRFLSEAAPACR